MSAIELFKPVLRVHLRVNCWSQLRKYQELPSLLVCDLKGFDASVRFYEGF